MVRSFLQALQPTGCLPAAAAKRPNQQAPPRAPGPRRAVERPAGYRTVPWSFRADAQALPTAQGRPGGRPASGTYSTSPLLAIFIEWQCGQAQNSSMAKSVSPWSGVAVHREPAGAKGLAFRSATWHGRRSDNGRGWSPTTDRLDRAEGSGRTCDNRATLTVGRRSFQAGAVSQSVVPEPPRPAPFSRRLGHRGRGDPSFRGASSPRVSSTIPGGCRSGSASELTVATNSRPSLMVEGRRRGSGAVDQEGDVTRRDADARLVDHTPSMSFRSVALRSTLNFVIASSMASIAWSRTSASRVMARSRGAGCTSPSPGSVGLALLHPLALPRLDHDRGMGGDAVAATQLTQRHRARYELAFERVLVADPVDRTRLGFPASGFASPRRGAE